MAGEADNKDEGLLLARGAKGTVEHAVRSNGDMEAKEWLDSAPLSIRVRFDHLFRKITATGRISNKEQFRKLRDQIWEFKRGGDRILCFSLGNRWLLTHHYQKGGQKCPPKQIERAERIMDEHIEREAKWRSKQ